MLETFTPEQIAKAKEVLAEVARRKGRPYLEGVALFNKQHAVLNDRTPVIAIHPGRRSGKTHTLMAWLFRNMQDNTGTTSVYLALTRGSAKRIMWEEMKRANVKYGLGFSFGEVELKVSDPLNGSCILLGGADDAEAIERLRGGKYQCAAIDECGSFSPTILKSLIVDILRPALGDLRGQLMLAGTPGRVCHGFWFDVCTDQTRRWSVHHWTVLDNPFFKEPNEYLTEERIQNGWSESHPIYRREWLGQWVQASDSLVYQYDPIRNAVGSSPESHGMRFVLGIDYGFNDSTAFAIWAYYANKPELWCVQSYKKSGLTPSAAAQETRDLMRQFGDFHAIIGDVGGLGKAYAEEAKQRFGIPIKAAEKRNKRGYIELMNGDFVSGHIRVVTHTNQAYIAELLTLPWKDANREEESPDFDNHITDASLYAYRECKAWNHDPDEIRAPKGSPEWWKEQEAKAWEHDDPKEPEHDLSWAEEVD